MSGSRLGGHVRGVWAGGSSAPDVVWVVEDPCDLRVRNRRLELDAAWDELWERRDREWELWN